MSDDDQPTGSGPVLLGTGRATRSLDPTSGTCTSGRGDAVSSKSSHCAHGQHTLYS